MCVSSKQANKWSPSGNWSLMAVILKMSNFTPPDFDFFDNFGPTPFFQLSEALFWPKRRPKILNFHPTRNFGHFWAPSLVTLLIFRNVMTREHLNTQNPQHTDHLNPKHLEP